MQRSTSQARMQIVRQWLTIVAVLVAIAINGISNAYPPAGKNTGEVSNTILGGVLITPAGYAFAIWGLIYIGLIAYSIYQALPAQRHEPAFQKASWGIIGACLLQITWIYVFLTFQFWLSVLLIIGIWLCLAYAYMNTRSVRTTWKKRWLFQAPISVYFGWITVATVVNIAGALYVMDVPAENLGEFSSTVTASPSGLLATVIMMAISAGLAAVVAWKYKDASYPAVIVWALSAIAIRHSALLAIAIVGVVLAVALSVLIVKIKVTRTQTA
ncbi:tryptophan-rich sensory protein [cf. Phormidesmis sp. LEGE 11477]|uniref:tryptophan-rich sensory protein n=1 Tax=cf. Phormidesmis sp. LEGE 11477 TaxID=1828680 RepID=UPI00187E4183|nr:tryptophan-rich sensory protein [cf. Phormidesmis sp. LEGE 11477]MBE9064766.1 tryptophan-rich sensory protein [cf. Phormidesmis sp. LEGE 11477]